MIAADTATAFVATYLAVIGGLAVPVVDDDGPRHFRSHVDCIAHIRRVTPGMIKILRREYGKSVPLAILSTCDRQLVKE